MKTNLLRETKLKVTFHPSLYFLGACLFFLLDFTCAHSQSREIDPARQWSGYRGILANGVFDNAGLPDSWDNNTGVNILWSVDLPGLGLSCPVIWGNRVFITTAIGTADTSGLKTGIFGDVGSVQDSLEHTWKIYCMDKSTGRLIWERTSHRGIPKIKRHPKSTHANCTVTTDGNHVVAFFGSEGLFCYTMDGKLLWEKNFGTLNAAFFAAPEAQWEFASSPLLFKGRVLIQCDVLENSFIAAFDAETGNEIWKTMRNDYPGWSTPNVYFNEGKPVVVVNGYNHIGGYDFETGKECWKMSGGGDIPIPTPVIGENLVYFNSAHGRQAPIFAVRKNASGDVTLAENHASNDFVAWSLPRSGSYMQTMVLYQGLLYSCEWNGGISCFDANTGERIYRNKLGTTSSFTASPVIADGKLYISDDDGIVYIVQTGKEYKVLNTAPLGDVCMTSPAIAEGLMIFRTQHHLVAVGKK